MGITNDQLIQQLPQFINELNEKQKKCMAKKKLSTPKPEPVSIKTARRDIAASWF